MRLNPGDPSLHSPEAEQLEFERSSQGNENLNSPEQAVGTCSNKQRMLASRIVKLSPLTGVEFSLTVDRSYSVSGKNFM